MSVAALPLVAMGVQAVGSIVGGIGANSEARASARVDEESARLALLGGEQDVAEVLRAERMASGEAIASMAGSGAGLGWGSAADILTEGLANRDRDIAALRTRAAGEARNYQQAAADKRAAGRNALIGSVFSAASNALSTAAGIKGGQMIDAQRTRIRTSTLGGSIITNAARSAGVGMRGI